VAGVWREGDVRPSRSRSGAELRGEGEWLYGPLRRRHLRYRADSGAEDCAGPGGRHGRYAGGTRLPGGVRSVSGGDSFDCRRQGDGAGEASGDNGLRARFEFDTSRVGGNQMSASTTAKSFGLDLLAMAPFRRLSVPQYHQMIAKGILPEGEPIELIEGYLVEKMSRGTPHDETMDFLDRIFATLITSGWYVRNQRAITLSD